MTERTLLPGQPNLWYPLVRPSEGVQSTLVCEEGDTDSDSQIEESFATIRAGYSLAILHRHKKLAIPHDAWSETFLVIPSGGGAQALLSVETGAAFRLGNPLLPGGRLRTRFLRACLKLPGMAGALCMQPRERLTIITRPKHPDDPSEWQTMMTPVAVVEGVPGPLQKLVVLHVDNEHKHIYKLAGSVLARRAIQHEIQALTSLHGSGLAPKLVARDYGAGPAWFAQETVQGKRPKPQLTSAVMTWLVSLATRAHDHVSPDKLLPSIYDGRDWSKVGPEYDQLANIVRNYWSNSKVPCTQSHGDFTPWNARMHENRLQAFDWEFYRMERPALFDLFHYLLQSSVLLRQGPADQAMERAFRVIRSQATPLTRVTAVEDSEIEPLGALYLLLVAERDSILNEIERPEFAQVQWLTSARSAWAKQLCQRMAAYSEGNRQAG